MPLLNCFLALDQLRMSGGRPCSPGCFPPTSAAARPVAVALRIVAALTDPASIRTCLEGVGLPSVPPPRAPPQPQFEFAA